jgi:hypothetical protein
MPNKNKRRLAPTQVRNRRPRRRRTATVLIATDLNISAPVIGAPAPVHALTAAGIELPASRPRKRPRRELLATIAKHAFPPDGVPPAHMEPMTIVSAMCQNARGLGHKLDRNKDRNTILRAVGRKK